MHDTESVCTPLTGCFLWGFDRLDDPSQIASDAVFSAEQGGSPA
jgi:hypothetical protein